MDLADLTAPALIDTALAGGDRHSVLRSLAELLGRSGRVGNVEALHERLEQREAIGSTGIGHGIAVPHCKMARLDQVVLAIGVTAKPIPYAAIDGAPVRLFFAVVSPEGEPAAHLRCLAEISRWAKDAERVGALLRATTPGALYALLPGAVPEAATTSRVEEPDA